MGLKSLQGSNKLTLPSIKRSLDARTLHQLYNDILKPLTLFPSHKKHIGPDHKVPNEHQKYPDDNKRKEDVDGIICKEDLYAHAVAPFMKDVRSVSPDVFCDVIKRRLHSILPLNTGSPDVKQIFEGIILSEVKDACENIPDVLCNSLLTASEKQHLHRRLLSHIMVVSEQLFLRYLHKMAQSKWRSLFSEEANLTRCKAQLLLDCSKFFNVFSASRYIISEIKELKGKELSQTEHGNVPTDTVLYSHHLDKRTAVHKPSTLHFTMEYFINLARPDIDLHKDQRDTHLMQIKNIQGLDLQKAMNLIPRQEDYSKYIKNMHYEAVTTPCSFKHDADQETEENVYAKHGAVMKKSMSCPNLRIGDLLADELRITFKRCAAECPEIASTSKAEVLKENLISNDLRRLIQDCTLHSSRHVENQCADEEIPPLIRALGPGHQNAAKQKKMEALPQDLNKKSEEPEEKQTNKTIFHPQPITADVQIPNRPLLRRMDAQASDRIFTHMTEIQKYPPIYNHFASEIEADTVKKLDRNLYVGQELEEVYTELVKNLSTNHLSFDQDLEFEPYATKLDFSACAASSTLIRKTNQRVINKELDSLAAIAECESVTQPPAIDKEATRHCSSWLAWWKSVVNTDDYMKYVSTQDLDYLKIIYHLYNSDSEDEEEERIARLKKQKEQKRQREKRIADIRAEKQSYRPGMWNVNSVMLGGLGSDPPVHDVELEINEKLDTSAQGDTAVSHEDLQKKISVIWNALHVPEDQRLDMAIKYSSEEYRDQLPKAIQVWQKVVKLIQNREKMLVELERFEKDASDPNRFFLRGYSGTSLARMEESKQRKKLHKQMADTENDIAKALQFIKKTFNDTVSYKGRPYAEKMKWDKTEMLYWLQQQRRKTLVEMDIQKDKSLFEGLRELFRSKHGDKTNFNSKDQMKTKYLRNTGFELFLVLLEDVVFSLPTEKPVKPK
ncbi:coiled-coil domain-containing protein 87 [Gastrophryne carolinensis]